MFFSKNQSVNNEIENDNIPESDRFEEVYSENLQNITGDSYDELFRFRDKITGEVFVLYKGYRTASLVKLK